MKMCDVMRGGSHNYYTKMSLAIEDIIPDGGTGWRSEKEVFI